MARGQRSYSEDEKASALALLDGNGGNVFRTARQLDMPRATLQEWRDGRGVNADVLTRRQGKKAELSARYESLVHDVLDVLTPAKLKDAGVRDLAVVVGVFTDKMLALDGESAPPAPPAPPVLTPEQQRRIEQLRAAREGCTAAGSDASKAAD
jgi:transposase-like protein